MKLRQDDFFIASVKFINQPQPQTIVFDSYDTFEEYRKEHVTEIQHYSIGLCIGFTDDDAIISDDSE